MQTTASYVTAYPCAAPEDVISVYTAKLAMETDCADVHAVMALRWTQWLLVVVQRLDQRDHVGLVGAFGRDLRRARRRAVHRGTPSGW